VSGELVPVEVVREPDHEFVGPRKPREKCQVCGRVASNLAHHAYPESFNEGGSGHNIWAYQNAKKAWTGVLIALLEQAELPRPLSRVLVEGELTFPRRYGKGPDQENYRYPLSKFLGDALVEGGWLPDDRWDLFEFGGLAYRLERGVQRMRLIVFGTVTETLEVAA
jgi:hypothetical protein